MHTNIKKGNVTTKFKSGGLHEKQVVATGIPSTLNFSDGIAKFRTVFMLVIVRYVCRCRSVCGLSKCRISLAWLQWSGGDRHVAGGEENICPATSCYYLHYWHTKILP